jgi:hypothetical protein
MESMWALSYSNYNLLALVVCEVVHLLGSGPSSSKTLSPFCCAAPALLVIEEGASSSSRKKQAPKENGKQNAFTFITKEMQSGG